MRWGVLILGVVLVGATRWTGTPVVERVRFDSDRDRSQAIRHTQATNAGTVGAQGTRTRFVTAADGNEVRYRVREQLANIEFPSDAIGATTAITGAIVIEDNGTIAGDASRFVVDLTGLTSDAQMRDRYIQRNTLETADSANMNAVFVPVSFAGLTFPLPASGNVSFRVTGNFTVRGATRSTTWDVTAQPTATGVRGTARTAFTFDDIGLAKPRVARVLSVADTIRLEYDFNLVRDPAR